MTKVRILDIESGPLKKNHTVFRVYCFKYSVFVVQKVCVYLLYQFQLHYQPKFWAVGGADWQIYVRILTPHSHRAEKLSPSFTPYVRSFVEERFEVRLKCVSRLCTRSVAVLRCHNVNTMQINSYLAALPSISSSPMPLVQKK